MDQDKFALVEKILKDVDTVMSKNAELLSFDIIPVEINIQNKSPVLHLENCLGLESWCVKHVYMYCYNELMDTYFSKAKRKCSKVTSLNSDRLTKLLNIVLLLNPELTTFWNKRREIINRKLLDKFFEIKFSRLVLSRKPKCNDAFTHRRWLLDIILEDDNIQRNQIEDLVNDELNICKLTSDKCPNNYHSWSHRMWLVKKLQIINRQLNLDLLYIKEYEFSELWTTKHVSDFSCYHYRQFCIKNIYSLDIPSWMTLLTAVNVDLRKQLGRILAANFPKDETVQTSESNLISYSEHSLVHILFGDAHKSCNCPKDSIIVCRKLEILFHELSLNNDLIKFYKHHETLWYHRRFIVHEILSLMYGYYGLIRTNGVIAKNGCKKCNPDNEELIEKQAKIIRYDSTSIYSSVLFRVLVRHESSFCHDRNKDSDNYAERHVKYLKFVQGFNNVM